MATLSAWKFDSPEGAARAEAVLVDLAKQELIQIHDAATVEWPEGRKRPKTHQASDMTAAGAAGGAFWGLLFGLLFFIPLLGMALGAGAGALGGSLTDIGIDDDFIDAVKQKITPGTSALFLLSSDAVLDKLLDAFGEEKPELIQTNLSNEEEAKLRAIFSDED